jgi:hypothetical protein
VNQRADLELVAGRGIAAANGSQAHLLILHTNLFASFFSLLASGCHRNVISTQRLLNF